MLGHVHAGTTALAKSLKVSGVHFNDRCNPLLEDTAIVQMYLSTMQYKPSSVRNIWNGQHTKQAQQIIIDSEQQAEKASRNHWGFKHPLTIIHEPQWSALLPNIQYIATVRSPHSWALTMDGHKAVGFCTIENKTNTGWWEEVGQEWLHAYKPLVELRKKRHVPVVIFGAEDYEDQLEKSFDSIGLEYLGGYKPKLVHVANKQNYIPDCCKETWDALCH